MSLRSLWRDQDVRRCGEEGSGRGNVAAWAQHPPRDWRHWLRLSIEQRSTGQMGSEQRWQRYQHSPVWVTRPETTPGLAPVSVKTVCDHRGQNQPSWLKWSVWTCFGAWSEDVLPGAVPRNEVAPWSGPEDVQHADVLPTVLGQIFRSVWWVLFLLSRQMHFLFYFLQPYIVFLCVVQ